MAGRDKTVAAPDSIFTDAVRRLIRTVEATLPASFTGTVRCHIVEGCAVHLYTGYRASEDLDALFRPGVVLAETPVVTYTDEGGKPAAIVLDRNYTDVLAVMHPDWVEDCWEWERFGRVEAVVISPVDLAVSKVARFADSDRLAIVHLAGAGLLEAGVFEGRVREAMEYYVGDTRFVRYNVAEAAEVIREWSKQP